MKKENIKKKKKKKKYRCVPKKIMWTCANIATILKDYSKYYGYTFDNLQFNMSEMKQQRDKYIKFLNEIYEKNLKNEKVTLIKKKARFVSPKTVQTSDGELFSANKVLITVGGQPYIPQIPGCEHIWTSDDVFKKLENVPRKLAIIGAGYIAVELAQVMQELGSDVSLFIRGNHPLRKFDRLISCGVHEALLKSHVNVIPNTNIKSISKSKNNDNTFFFYIRY